MSEEVVALAETSTLADLPLKVTEITVGVAAAAEVVAAVAALVMPVVVVRCQYAMGQFFIWMKLQSSRAPPPLLFVLSVPFATLTFKVEQRLLMCLRVYAYAYA